MFTTQNVFFVHSSFLKAFHFCFVFFMIWSKTKVYIIAEWNETVWFLTFLIKKKKKCDKGETKVAQAGDILQNQLKNQNIFSWI